MRKKIFWFIFANILLLSSGCWDSIELENRAFAVAIGIDAMVDKSEKNDRPKEEKPKEETNSEEKDEKSEENDNSEGKDEKPEEKNESEEAEDNPNEKGQSRFRFFATIAHPSEDSGGGEEGNSNDVEEEENNDPSALGQTVIEAIRALDARSSRKLFLGHVKAIVLGKSLLEDQTLFREAIATIENYAEIDRTITVLATDSKVSDVLSAHPQGESKPGYYVVNFYRLAPKSGGRSFHKTFNDMTNDLRTTGNTLLPFIQEGQQNNENLLTKGALVIKDYQLAGELDGIQLRGLLWATNKACQDAILTTNDHISMIVRNHKSKLHFSEEAGRLRCIIDVRVKGEIESFQNNKSLNEEYEQLITGEINNAIQKLQQELEFDGFNFMAALRKQRYSLYQQYSSDWAETFKNMEITPLVRCNIIF
ncbi:MAG: Ger(x)C family spore germination protein [Defluviitaleaceae bacterium]|nr:Ger(x)C family spore germination protein [Defluviitaleaceae bacterium]